MTSRANWYWEETIQSYLTTELNSLANGGEVLGGAINGGGSTGIALELSLATQGSARSAGAYVSAYLVPSIDDGTTYNYGAASLLPGSRHLLATFEFDAATTARVAIVHISLPGPGYWKVLVENNTGQVLAASGNTLKYRRYVIRGEDT